MEELHLDAEFFLQVGNDASAGGIGVDHAQHGVPGAGADLLHQCVGQALRHDGAHELPGQCLPRVGENLFDRSVFDEVAVFQHRHMVGDGGNHIHLVGDNEDGHAQLGVDLHQ